ncbi:hypothetical protein TNCV_695411 [Trichonephila clavipes]|nr:hypothetical protein TNCV_695411 [Trichonephila clavipes]
MTPRLWCTNGVVHITARVTSKGRKVHSGYRSFRTNASTSPITPRRSSLREVDTSSYKLHTITYSPASVSLNRRKNDSIFVASM